MPSVPSSFWTSVQASGHHSEGAEGAKNLWVRTGYRKRKRTFRLALGSWNMRTLLERKESNLPEGQTALVTRESKDIKSILQH